MYLHLGQDTVVRTSDIIAIFDLENASIAKSTKGYLASAQKTGWWSTCPLNFQNPLLSAPKTAGQRFTFPRYRRLL